MTSPPLWLSIESATGPCSVALGYGNDVRSYISEPTPGQQASLLVPMIERALKHIGAAYADLAGVITTVGPGSFTSLRIGLATARGIGFSAGKPVRGVTTLSAMAYAAREHTTAETLACVVPSGLFMAYFQMFHVKQALQPLGLPEILTYEDVKAKAGSAFLITGSSYATPGLTPSLILPPDARTLLAIAAESDDALFIAPEPLYIRPPDAKLPDKSLFG